MYSVQHLGVFKQVFIITCKLMISHKLEYSDFDHFWENGESEADTDAQFKSETYS